MSREYTPVSGYQHDTLPITKDITSWLFDASEYKAELQRINKAMKSIKYEENN